MAKKKEKLYLREPTGIVLPQGKKVFAHITGLDRGHEGYAYVRWELWAGRKCIARAINEKRLFFNPKIESRAHCIQQLVAKAEDAFREEYFDPNGNADFFGTSEGGIFKKALDSLDESEIELLRKPTWGENTWKNYFSAFRRLLNELDTLEKYDLESLKKLREQMIEQATKSKRSKGRQKAAENVDKILLALIYSLDALRTLVNEREGRNVLPEISLYDVITPGRRYQFEQIKWLPFSVVIRLVVLLFARIESGICMGIAAMLSFGVRTGECVAILIGELELIDGCIVRYKVCHQGPERSIILKTQNAYRIVLAGRLFYDLIMKRIEYLRTLGFSDEEIKEMPLVCQDDDPKKPVNIEKLSEMARNLLLEAGYCMSNIILASKLMLIEPDYEADGSLMRSVSAYIFRRHFATMICNCCDLFPGSGIEDYLLGHARKKTLPFDVKSLDVQRELVRKMERIVYAPEHTENPLYRAIGLNSAEGKKVYDLNEYSAYSFVAESEVEIEIIVQSHEPNGRLYFDTDTTRNRRTIKRQSGKKDTLENRANRPIIPMPLLPEEFKKIFSGAANEETTEESI